ncbi:MAG: galactose-1-phosphate uridylyltransferase [Phycicoccus sp.]|nr:galactose-1-phosphate uridylyltransferase [Phycicoccus sp.]
MRARRTSRTLSDGREIIYYDDVSSTPRLAPDTRDLGPRVRAGQIRRDPLVGDWVAVAGHRQHRTFQPPRDECPLCPSGIGSAPSEIPEADYDVVVFENRFPSYAAEADPGPSGPNAAPDLLSRAPARGRCEVVCFTSAHDVTFADLSVDRVSTVIDVWAERTERLSALEGIASVFCFENRGDQIGVTLSHPHGQIYAYPRLPARTAALLDQAHAYAARTGRLLGADILATELADGRRIVLESEHWVAYVPFAARWPVEVHLVPRRDVPDLPALGVDERADLAVAYLRLLRALDRYYVSDAGEPIRLPYIAGWQQAPAGEGRDVSRLHLQVMSILRTATKVKYLAGSESGVGGWVVDVSPETVAARLRELA